MGSCTVMCSQTRRRDEAGDRYRCKLRWQKRERGRERGSRPECRHERIGSALMEDGASEMGDEDSSDAMADVVGAVRNVSGR